MPVNSITIADYCLTTILPPKNNRKPLQRNDFRFSRSFCFDLCRINETTGPQAFSIRPPDNSDSEGRWFDSGRAYQIKRQLSTESCRFIWVSA